MPLRRVMFGHPRLFLLAVEAGFGQGSMIKDGMDIREATEAFTAMDAYGHPQTTIPKHAILHGVGDDSGFRGRIDAGSLASFVYLGCLFYARKDAQPSFRASRRIET